MEARIVLVKEAYANLVLQLRYMDIELARVTAQEATKRIELSERRALLADRVRNAYDSDRTSPLETFLSGGTFTELLAEMSYYIDVGEQDQALADQITRDKETLAAIHQTVADTRVRTNELRKETAAQKRALDKSLIDLKETKAELARLQKAVAKTLREQKARYAALKRSKANAAAIIRKAAADQKRLAKRIDSLIARQISRGNIPSEFNGTMRWPMDSFNVSGNYGCSTFASTPRATAARTSTTASTSSPPTARRSRQRPRARWSTSAGTGPTAPTRRGSSSSPTRARSRPGTPTCSRSDRCRSASR